MGANWPYCLVVPQRPNPCVSCQQVPQIIEATVGAQPVSTPTTLRHAAMLCSACVSAVALELVLLVNFIVARSSDWQVGAMMTLVCLLFVMAAALLGFGGGWWLRGLTYAGLIFLRTGSLSPSRATSDS